MLTVVQNDHLVDLSEFTYLPDYAHAYNEHMLFLELSVFLFIG